MFFKKKLLWTPENYIPIFKKMNIKLIIRLNKPKYNKNIFIKSGILHKDLIFPDGTNPSQKIIKTFFDIIDKQKGAIAIHCKAGLGRTGTLIALYLMKNYRICSTDVIAWLRILRPGSILGPQQHFLIEKQKYCFLLSENSPIFNSFNKKQKDLSYFLSSVLIKPKTLKKFKSYRIIKKQGDYLLTKKQQAADKAEAKKKAEKNNFNYQFK